MACDPLDRKRKLLRGMIGLSVDPRRCLRRLTVVLISIDITLVVLHFVFSLGLSDIAEQTADGHIGVFDLDQEGTLAVWVSSVQLMLIGVTCYFISWLDRGAIARLPNDWIWKFASFLFVFMSLDETASVHETVGGGMHRIMRDIPISASMWWTIPYALSTGLVLGFSCLRFVRRPRLLGGVVCGGALWILATLLEHVFFFPRQVNIALEEGFEMFGTTILLITFISFLLQLAREELQGIAALPDSMSKPLAG